MPRKVRRRKPKPPTPRGKKAVRPVLPGLDALLSSPEFADLLASDDLDLPPGENEPSGLDPELMLAALTHLSIEARDAGTATPIIAATRAFSEVNGLSDEDPVTEEDIPTIVELSRRLTALTRAMTDLDAGPDDRPALAIVACMAELHDDAKDPRFDAADFAALLRVVRSGLG